MMMRFTSAVLGLILLLSFPLIRAHAQEGLTEEQPPVSAKQLVVMIDGRFPTTGALTSGAGIVVGRKGGLVYIATARHVIEDIAETAVDLKVQFADKPGVEIDAFVLQNELEKSLDLALIGVPEALAPDLIKGSTSYKVARLEPKVTKGEGVSLLGQPGGKPWKLSPKGQEVLQSGLTELEISSSDAEPGYSGGAAIDENSRIVGLIVSTEGTIVSIIPLAAIKEQIEKQSFPFDLKNTLEILAISSENDTRIKTLRSLGVDFSKQGYLTSIRGRKTAALDIFHQEQPLLNADELLEWVQSEQNGFTPEERGNAAYFAGHFDVPQNQKLKEKISIQYNFIRDALKIAAKEGISIETLCDDYLALKPVVLTFEESACKKREDESDFLLALYDLNSNFDHRGLIKLEDYGIHNYIPKWFSAKDDPEDIKFVEFYNTESEATVPECGYSIARSRFTVWDNKYVVIPDFGKAILTKNAQYNSAQKSRDVDICYSFDYNGNENTQHVECSGDILLYRHCNSDIVTFIDVRNHLIDENERIKRINELDNKGRLTNEAWKANESAASIWPSPTSNSAILYLSCRGNLAFVMTELDDIIGLLPNKFDLLLDFGREKHILKTHGQSGNDGRSYSSYTGFASKGLLAALSGNYGEARLSIDGIEIGTIPLKDSTWAMKKGLKGCL